MALSKENAIALLLDVNQDIEEYAEATVRNIVEDKNFDLIYPPNNGLTDEERAALGKLDNNEYLKSALRKVIADNTAQVFFNMFNVLDGTSSPKLYSEKWTGVQLVDDDPDIDEEPFEDMLHDAFFDTYWIWKENREDKGWSLDTYEG